jgi:glycerate kinase
VTNVLYGPSGAAAVYGPQKGATPEQVKRLDDALRGLATRLGKTRDAAIPGSGAAGGLGFGMVAFFGAGIRHGAAMVLDATRLAERLRGADLCITGEGRLDASSLHGKAPIGVAQLCKEIGVPCLALVGSVGEGAERVGNLGVTAYDTIGEGLSEKESIRRAGELLTAAAARRTRAAITASQHAQDPPSKRD